MTKLRILCKWGGDSFSFLLQSKRTSIVAEWKEASFWFCLETNVETLNKRKDILSLMVMEWDSPPFVKDHPLSFIYFICHCLASSAFPSIPSKSISSHSHFANQNFSSKSFRFGYLPIKITKANLSLIPDLIEQNTQ